MLDEAPGLPGAGRVIAGRYRLLEPVGRGGMGVVWRARDDVLDREVAVKEVLLPPGLDDDARLALPRRAIREARSAARLNHPGVVTVFDVVEEDGRPWVVMELVRARSLQQVIGQDGTLSPERAARIGRQIVEALGAAHAAGILHRDVKPGNVLIAAGDRAVLTDFGIAVIEGDSSLTQTGGLLGSPAYIAPERIRGERAQPASDLWALGATLYAAVTGQVPFQRDDPVAVFGAVLAEEPTIPPHAEPLRPVLEGLLRKDPARRMPAGVAEAVLLVIGGEEQTPQTSPAGVPVAAHQTRSDPIIPDTTSVLGQVAGSAGTVPGPDPGTDPRGGHRTEPANARNDLNWRLGGLMSYAGIVFLLLGALLAYLSMR